MMASNEEIDGLVERLAILQFDFDASTSVVSWGFLLAQRVAHGRYAIGKLDQIASGDVLLNHLVDEGLSLDQLHGNTESQIHLS